LTKKPILLISFYNPKALGIRYLEKSLKNAGYPVYIIFLKIFNSRKPGNVTKVELGLVKDVVNLVKPGIIGLSVMTSLYLETVYIVNEYLKANFDIPILWGGVYPTLFPEKSLEHADFVIRGEGEKAVVELASALFYNTDYEDIRNNIINLKVIRFWDEIFPDNKEWVEEFTERYKREINLPFEIWIHPLKISYDLIKKLVDAGLYKAVMGIQSGSPRIRKEIFGRYELQEDIINASKILSDCRVPRVIYDFILRHPFETEEDIIKSFELCMKLHPPFELQLHALNFFPGTDIVEKAIKLNVIDRNELEKIMYAPIKEQYKAYWGVNDNDIMINFWYSLIYMTQFKTIRPLISFLSKHVQSLNKKFTFLIELSIKLQKYLVPIARMKDYYKKIYLILRIGY